MYNDTITLFNRKEGDEGDTWFPSVLKNVQLNMDRAAVVEKYGSESADNAILNVRYTKNGQSITISGKPWLPPKEWEKLDDPRKAVTFTTGDRFDFFIYGDWGSEEPVNDSDFFGTSSMDFYTYVNKKYDYVFAITSVGGPYSLIPHFEVHGK